MTELEKKVAELRAKYDAPVKKYYDAWRTMYSAMLGEEGEKYWKLVSIYDKLFPFKAHLECSHVLTCMGALDNDADDDTYDVWKNSYLTELEKWKTEMEKIDI